MADAGDEHDHAFFLGFGFVLEEHLAELLADQAEIGVHALLWVKREAKHTWDTPLVKSLSAVMRTRPKLEAA